METQTQAQTGNQASQNHLKIKNMSHLFPNEAKVQIKNCKEHGEYEAKVIHITNGGKTLFSSCPICEKERKSKEDGRNNGLIAEFVAKLHQESGVPLRYENIKILDYIISSESEKIVKYIKNYINNFSELKHFGCSIVLCGKPGTGKTHLACAVANELIETGEKAKYTSAYKIISEVKSTYSTSSKGAEQEVFKKLKEFELLIIDEVGIQFGSETEKMILYQIINDRYENMLPTIIISNLNYTDLNVFLGGRVLDRLKEGRGAVLAFDWESFRVKNKEPAYKEKRLSALEKYKNQF